MHPRHLAAMTTAAALAVFAGTATANSVIYNGYTHTSTGAASVALAGSNLVVSGIGSSGNDGVAIALSTTHVTVAMTSLGTAAATATGVFLDASALGHLNGSKLQSLGSSRVIDAGASLNISADFAPIGAGNKRVIVRNGSTVVFDGTTTNTIVASAGSWPSHCVKGPPFGDPFPVPCFWWRWPAPIAITIAGGPTVNGTEIRVLYNGAATLREIQGLTLAGKDIAGGMLTITGETIEAPPVPGITFWMAMILCVGLVAAAIRFLPGTRQDALA